MPSNLPLKNGTNSDVKNSNAKTLCHEQKNLISNCLYHLVIFYKLDPDPYFKTRKRFSYFDLLYEATEVWTVQKEPDEHQVAVKLPFIQGKYWNTKEELTHKTKEAWYWTDSRVVDKEHLPVGILCVRRATPNFDDPASYAGVCHILI
jgi:hypothetical protein